MKSPKTCPTCGIEFVDPKHPDRKFCSLKCSSKAHTKHPNKHEPRSCAHCGKMFVSTSPNTKCCSMVCAAKNRPQRQRTRVAIYTCEWCKQEFEGWMSRPNRFCSRLCAGRFGARQPKPTARRPENFVTLTCETCGNPYTVHKIFTESRNSRFCSIKCRGVSQSLEKRGAGNVNYRGGAVTYRGQNWGHQRRLAAERDGWKCQICGKRINRKKWDYGVHHIKPYREFNGDWESANQLSNLITLCRSCHSKVEFGGKDCPQRLF